MNGYMYWYVVYLERCHQGHDLADEMDDAFVFAEEIPKTLHSFLRNVDGRCRGAYVLRCHECDHDYCPNDDTEESGRMAGILRSQSRTGPDEVAHPGGCSDAWKMRSTQSH